MRYRPRSAYLLREDVLDKIFSPGTRRRIAELTDPLDVLLTQDNWRLHAHRLRDVEYIISGWGMVPLDEAFLQAAPNLRHVFYASGSVRCFYTELARERGVGVSSSWRANAIPTAEFAHAVILLALKQFWRAQRSAKAERNWRKPAHAAGIFDSTVGIVSLGEVGRRLAGTLAREHRLDVVAYDPFVSPVDAAGLGVRLVALEELFATADVISLHCPSLPETRHLIDGGLLASMKPHATLVNTARGDVIDEAALCDVLRARPDLDAILDVTTDEPCNEHSPLWDLPNVVITPHIAGSINRECHRMGEYMAEELERYLSGLGLEHEVTEALFSRIA
ncbi:MAG: hydroxyacid dehydrogenase [Verrucomicrobiota bacterium]